MKNIIRIMIALVLLFSLTVTLVACTIPDTEGSQGSGGSGQSGSGQGGSQGSGSSGQGSSGQGGSQSGGSSGQDSAKPAETEGLEYTYIEETDSYKVTGYTGTATEVTVPASHRGKPVTVIGAAFYENSSITKVTLPDTVTELINSAFAFCTSLGEIEFGSGLKTVGDGAFSTCTSLTKVTLPDSVELVYSMAFNSCASLEEVTFGSGTTWIGRYVFNECPSLAKVTLPEGSWYHTTLRTKWLRNEAGEPLAFSTPEANALLLTGDYINRFFYKL